MFEFLKGLFKEKETEETVEQDKLMFWFDNKVKERLKNLDNEINLLFEGVGTRKKVIKERLELLEKAEIKDPEKIENKIKNIVLGHRDNYLRAMRIFLNELNIPEQKTLTEAVKFSDLLKARLDKLGKSTAKSYAASQHLFFNEVQGVVKGLKDLDSLSKNFDKVIERNKLKEIESVKMMMDLLYKKTSEKGKLNKELKLKNEKFNELKLNKGNKLKNIEILEQSDEYRNYLGLKDQKENLDGQIKENQSRFLEIFAQLERSWRKYEHLAAENLGLIRDYLENPIETFLKDNDLFFLKILERVKVNLESGIDLKESKKEKTLEIIGLVTERGLKEIQKKNEELQEERVILTKKIDNAAVYGKLSDLKYRLEHIDVKIADLEQEINEVVGILEKIDLEKIMAGIKEKIFEVFRVRLMIS